MQIDRAELEKIEMTVEKRNSAIRGILTKGFAFQVDLDKTDKNLNDRDIYNNGMKMVAELLAVLNKRIAN